MTRLLRVDASASDTSVSRRLAGAFIETLHTASPTPVDVIHRDLARTPAGNMDKASLRAIFGRQEDFSNDEKAASDARKELANEVASADILVLSSPMYNWSIPSNLKAWIDKMLVPGVTLPLSPTSRPLEKRHAIAFLAYGGSGSLRGKDESFDFCQPYISGLFETVLGYRTEIIVARNIGMMNSPESGSCDSFREAVEQSKYCATQIDLKQKFKADSNETFV